MCSISASWFLSITIISWHVSMSSQIPFPHWITRQPSFSTSWDLLYYLQRQKFHRHLLHTLYDVNKTDLRVFKQNMMKHARVGARTWTSFPKAPQEDQLSSSCAWRIFRYIPAAMSLLTKDHFWRPFHPVKRIILPFVLQIRAEWIGSMLIQEPVACCLQSWKITSTVICAWWINKNIALFESLLGVV